MTKEFIKRLFYRVGYLPVNIKDLPQGKRAQLIESLNINRVLDVGANTGQFARELRSFGYSGEIVSFEPLSEAFALLNQHAERDNRWQAVNCALGDSEGEVEINISANSYSSSILNIKTRHTNAAPDSVYVGKETVNVKMLDSLYTKYCRETDRVLLKLDTQGFEASVLAGAKETLGTLTAIQMELSLVPMYEKEVLFLPMIRTMEEAGFQLVGLAPGFSNPETGQLYQVDCFFIGKDIELPAS
jgi:FkbM family methyltransferase